MGIIKCRECGKMVSTEAIACPGCGAKPKKKIGVLGVFGIVLGSLFVIGVIGNLTESWNCTRKAANQTPSPSTTRPPSPPKPALTAAQHISDAKAALADGYTPNEDPTKRSWGNLTKAEKHILAIDKFADEQQKIEAGGILNEIERRKSEINRIAPIVAARLMVEQRKSLIPKLDRIFLDAGMDVEVLLEGEGQNILRLKYILWSRPLVHKFTKGGDMSQGSFLSNMKKAGFKEVHFDDKRDFDQYDEF